MFVMEFLVDLQMVRKEGHNFVAVMAIFVEDHRICWIFCNLFPVSSFLWMRVHNWTVSVSLNFNSFLGVLFSKWDQNCHGCRH